MPYIPPGGGVLSKVRDEGDEIGRMRRSIDESAEITDQSSQTREGNGSEKEDESIRQNKGDIDIIINQLSTTQLNQPLSTSPSDLPISSNPSSPNINEPRRSSTATTHSGHSISTPSLSSSLDLASASSSSVASLVSDTQSGTEVAEGEGEGSGVGSPITSFGDGEEGRDDAVLRYKVGMAAYTVS